MAEQRVSFVAAEVINDPEMLAELERCEGRRPAMANIAGQVVRGHIENRPRVRRRRHRLRSRTGAVPGALYRLHHGRVFPRQRHARPDHL